MVSSGIILQIIYAVRLILRSQRNCQFKSCANGDFQSHKYCRQCMDRMRFQPIGHRLLMFTFKKIHSTGANDGDIRLIPTKHLYGNFCFGSAQVKRLFESPSSTGARFGLAVIPPSQKWFRQPSLQFPVYKKRQDLQVSQFISESISFSGENPKQS